MGLINKIKIQKCYINVRIIINDFVVFEGMVADGIAVEGIAVEGIVVEGIVVEGTGVEGMGRGNVAFVGDMMGLG